MARVRNKGTDAELKLRKELWKKGRRYRLHLKLPGSPDLAFTSEKVAVFVDGCFWHGCPLHYSQPKTNETFWNNKLQRNLNRDREADASLLSEGWRVVRIWEHELYEDLDSVVEIILSELAVSSETS